MNVVRAAVKPENIYLSVHEALLCQYVATSWLIWTRQEL